MAGIGSSGRAKGQFSQKWKVAQISFCHDDINISPKPVSDTSLSPEQRISYFVYFVSYTYNSAVIQPRTPHGTLGVSCELKCDLYLNRHTDTHTHTHIHETWGVL